MPVFVASRDASSSGSNIGLKATVNAQSTIRPARNNRLEVHLIPKINNNKRVGANKAHNRLFQRGEVV